MPSAAAGATAGSAAGRGSSAVAAAAVRPRVQQLKHEVVSVADPKTIFCGVCTLPMAQTYRTVRGP